MNVRTVEEWLMHDLICNYYLLTVPNFYIKNYECDLFTLNKKLYTTEYEVKQSKNDFLNDFKKQRKKSNSSIDKKHDLIKNGKRTNKFYFVVHKKLDVEIPEYAGEIRFYNRLGRVWFEKVKEAPFLHKTKFDENNLADLIYKMNWRNYRLKMKLTKNWQYSNQLDFF